MKDIYKGIQNILLAFGFLVIWFWGIEIGPIKPVSAEYAFMIFFLILIFITNLRQK